MAQYLAGRREMMQWYAVCRLYRFIEKWWKYSSWEFSSSKRMITNHDLS
ncbi:TPA: hypothetical protein SMP05_003580 [Proteus mirabilis]|nr:hypothetical protein [Proteus mirabilis]MBI6354288.1 hypothetical protein [Proteus mirabilis]HEJ9736728.1 hypothetical protein [Proteus mirabilis]HEK0490021.1 hypothetical protein [Proteus mirabilis]HEK2029811.1 hypothetical protein [Proteus mirabilis]